MRGRLPPGKPASCGWLAQLTPALQRTEKNCKAGKALLDSSDSSFKETLHEPLPRALTCAGHINIG